MRDFEFDGNSNNGFRAMMEAAKETPNVDVWFSDSPKKIMKRLGVDVDERRAVELTNMFDGDLGGFYYVAEASQNGDEEAIKWILQALAAALNEKGWGFDKISVLLPADYLRTFVQYLSDKKFDRNFAREIFAELIEAPRYREVDGEVDFNYVCYDSRLGRDSTRVVSGCTWEELDQKSDFLVYETQMVRASMRLTPDEVLSKIINQPKFKAVDASDLDKMIDDIIAANVGQAEKVKEQPKLLQFFIGQTMKASKGKANAQIVAERLKEKLGV